MFAASSVTALTSSLVHQSVVAHPAERARHEAFITHKLALSFAALASGPFYLAYRGAPAPLESLIFSFALLPLIAAMVVARTGRIVTGHALMFLGLVALGIFLSLTSQVGVAGAVVWFMLAQAEAALSADPKLIRASMTGLAVLLVAFLGMADLTGSILPVSATAFLVSSGLALAYAITVASTYPRASTPVSAREDAVDHLQRLHELRGDLVVRFTSGAMVDSISGQVESVLGQDATTILGRGLFHIVHVSDRPAFLKLIADAADGHDIVSATLRLRIANDRSQVGFAAPRFMWADVSALRAGSSNDANADVIAILRDVTATHVETQPEVRAAEAEATHQSKDDFLANMSHELRTPLNAIIGFSEMLGSHTLRPADPDKQREYARIIHQSGQHLLSVVNAILDMSKLQSGTFTIIPEPFAIAPLVDQCCDIVRLKAQEGRVRLQRHCPEGLDQIVGDKRAVKQILINLLSNAVKFTPEQGDVDIVVKPDGDSILVTVSDDGIGIGPDDLQQLGNPFFQARAALNRPFEGTGLGLSVVRGLVGLHGGTMTIESETGKGTSVTVRLPLDCQSMSGRSTPASIETISRRQTETTRLPMFEPRMRSIA